MKLFNTRMMAYTALLASTLLGSSVMAADTVTVTVGATVANAITISQTTPMEFGTLIAINDGTETASITIDTADTLGTPTTTGAPAKIIGGISGSPTSADVSVTGVNGQTVQLQVTNVVNPVNGTDAFTLDNFRYLVPSGSETGIALNTNFALSATGAAQAVKFGARLTTPAQATLVADGAYAGSFDVVASY